MQSNLTHCTHKSLSPFHVTLFKIMRLNSQYERALYNGSVSASKEHSDWDLHEMSYPKNLHEKQRAFPAKAQ